MLDSSSAAVDRSVPRKCRPIGRSPEVDQDDMGGVGDGGEG